MRARALVGWEGCEVRLCDPCARVSPLCPRVSWLSPRTCLLYEILPGSWRVVVRVRWWLGWLIGWFKVGCEVRDTCVPCVWRLSRLPWFYRFARFGCPCVPCLTRVPWVSRLPPVSFYRFATKFTETSVAARKCVCAPLHRGLCWCDLPLCSVAQSQLIDRARRHCCHLPHRHCWTVSKDGSTAISATVACETLIDCLCHDIVSGRAAAGNFGPGS